MASVRLRAYTMPIGLGGIVAMMTAYKPRGRRCKRTITVEDRRRLDRYCEMLPKLAGGEPGAIEAAAPIPNGLERTTGRRGLDHIRRALERHQPRTGMASFYLTPSLLMLKFNFSSVGFSEFGPIVARPNLGFAVRAPPGFEHGAMTVGRLSDTVL